MLSASPLGIRFLLCPFTDEEHLTAQPDKCPLGEGDQRGLGHSLMSGNGDMNLQLPFVCSVLEAAVFPAVTAVPFIEALATRSCPLETASHPQPVWSQPEAGVRAQAQPPCFSHPQFSLKVLRAI